MCNATANALEKTPSRMSLIRDRFTVEILYKPSILDNITNLSVFNDHRVHQCINIVVVEIPEA